jgi:VWFA-related protein
MAHRKRTVAVAALTAAAFVSAQAVRENVRVGLVSVRIDVRGSDGKMLLDVKPSDLHLSVDGKSVTIEGLDLASAANRTASPAPVPASAAIAASAPSPSPSSGNSLYLDVLFDETATNTYDRRDVFRELATFLKDKTSPDVHVMLQKFDGRLRTECPWTTDPAVAVAAEKKMEKHLSDSRVPSPTGLKHEIQQGRTPRDIEMQIDLMGRRSFDGILQALIRFPDVPGRKGLVVITDGTPLMSPYDLAMTLASTTTMQRTNRVESLESHGDVDAAKQLATELEQATLTDFGAAVGTTSTWANRLARVTNKALELDIAFYPVDSEAPDRGTNPGTGDKWPGRSMAGVPTTGNRSGMPTPGDLSARVGVAQSMTVLADATGGQAILMPRFIASRLGTVADDRNSGYVLTFRDPSPGDGKYHSLDIRVDRPGTQLVYRRGYRVRTDDERTLDAVVAHLEEPTLENPFHLNASFEILRKEGGRDIVQMRLAFTPTEAPGDPNPERAVQVWAVCSDDDGNRATPIVRKSQAQRLGTAEGAFADAIQMGLPPGPYTWSVALRDVATGVTSYAVVRKPL